MDHCANTGHVIGTCKVVPSNLPVLVGVPEVALKGYAFDSLITSWAVPDYIIICQTNFEDRALMLLINGDYCSQDKNGHDTFAQIRNTSFFPYHSPLQLSSVLFSFPIASLATCEFVIQYKLTCTHLTMHLYV